MSTSISRFFATGNVLGEPDQHSTGTQTIVTFAIAIHYKDEPVVKVRCKVFGALGQNAQRYVKSGQLVAIDGHDLKPYSYTTQQGNPATILEVNLDQFRILSSKKDQLAE
jgi:single-stranded DNA-binding protein